jgi:hypothetical protein
MDSCVLFVNGQPFLVVSVAGIEIARLELSLQVALTLIALGIPICALNLRYLLKEGFCPLFFVFPLSFP